MYPPAAGQTYPPAAPPPLYSDTTVQHTYPNQQIQLQLQQQALYLQQIRQQAFRQQTGHTLPSAALLPQAQHASMAANIQPQPVLQPAEHAQHSQEADIPPQPLSLQSEPSQQPSGQSAAAPHVQGNNEVEIHASERKPARILAIEAVTSSGVNLADATMAVDAVAQAFSQDADPIG